MRHPLLISLATGILAFAAANVAESALIAARDGTPWLAAWTSEVLLSLDARAFTLGLLVTDGVVEALEAEGDPDEILDSLAARGAGGTPEAACAAVMQRALRAGPSPLAPPDDRTVLAFIPGGHRG